MGHHKSFQKFQSITNCPSTGKYYSKPLHTILPPMPPTMFTARKLRIAKGEFDQMLELRITTPEKYYWFSPLHLFT